MASPFQPAEPADKYDPVYLNSCREARYILVLFAICLVWSIGVCYWGGYAAAGPSDPPSNLWLGMPGWVFWGILLPWLFADLATIWFCFVYMVDDPLGPEEEEEDDWSGGSASAKPELPDA